MAGKVTIKSGNLKTSKLVEQIDKLSLLWVWIAKAAVLLDEYLVTLNGLSSIADQKEIGRKIQECECYIMSSVTIYLRCFLDQQATHLNIDEITKDGRLRKCFDEMLQLRHDEFVHWKGLRSRTQALYTLSQFERNNVKFEDSIETAYEEDIGPPQDVQSMKELFRLSGDYVLRRRVEILRKLEAVLSSEDELLMTQICDESGNRLLPKET